MHCVGCCFFLLSSTGAQRSAYKNITAIVCAKNNGIKMLKFAYTGRNRIHCITEAIKGLLISPNVLYPNSFKWCI